MSNRARNPIMLLKDASLTLIIRISGLVLQVVVFALIARLYSLEAVGLYAIANSMWQMTRILGPLGHSEAALRFVSGYIDQNQPEKQVAFLRLAVSRTNLVSAGLSILLLLIAYWLYFHGPADYQPYGLPLCLFVSALPAYSLLGLYINIFRVRGELIWAQAPDSLVLQSLFTIAIGALYATGLTTTPQAISWLLAAQALVTWITLGIYYFRLRGLHRQYANTIELDGHEQREIQTMARSVLGAIGVTALSNRGTVVLVSAIVGPAATALYEAASRFAILATISTWSVSMAVSPMMAKAQKRGDDREVQDLYTIGSILQTIPAIVLFLLILVFGRWMLGALLGVSYEQAYLITVMFMFATLLNASAGMSSIYLMMGGEEKIMFRYSLWKLIMLFVLIPPAGWLGGLTGIALVLIAATILRDLGMTYWVAKHKGVKAGVWSLSELGRSVSMARAGWNRLSWEKLSSLLKR